MKPIRNWRIVGETDSGAYCFFDPSREAISVRDLTSDERQARIENMVAVTPLEAEAEIPWLPLFSKKSEVPF